MSFKDILKGHINEVTKKNDKLSEKRLEICYKCPMIKFTKEFGPICNPNKWIDPASGDTKDRPTPGYVQGCRCRLQAKTRVEDSHCIVYKW